MNEIGGYRKDLVVALTGLDIEEKAAPRGAAPSGVACPFHRDEYDSVTTRSCAPTRPIRTDQRRGRRHLAAHAQGSR